MEKKMTEREFLTAIVNGNVSDEIKAYAEEGIAKLDAKNEKRKNTPTKNQEANAALKARIIELLADGAKVASEIGVALEVSTQKASALLVQLTNEGKVAQAEIKVPKKGAVKSYSLVG